ncbi:MAG: hypothetical protein BWY95_00057 [Bacteroidetes bacterium ADurb.BinA104]|nr:MAG: hypothetical protein BWY95_00057 [Bacteroidetes bacterium ADurb.BinA104]
MAETENASNVIVAQSVECKFVKTEPALVEKLAIKRGLPVQAVKSMMRYNVFTVNQFVSLTGLPVSTVTNKTRPSVVNGQIYFDLDPVYPFQDAEGTGPKFILRNEKSERYLKS